MPGWFSVAAPYLADILTVAKPLFTRTRDARGQEVVAQQITELQNAATQNADSVRLLATEMQKTLDALQAGADMLEQRLHRAQLLAAVAATVAVFAVVIALFALVH